MMTDGTPTHWTQFNQLYNLPDPRPYFLGVATGDYRMPAVAAQVLEALLPVIAARSEKAIPHLMDFACGYGAVGLCLRNGLTMREITAYYQHSKDEPRTEDAAHFLQSQRENVPPHHIVGVDIADVAVDYGRAVGALDAGRAVNILDAAESLTAEINETDLFFECGAIGDMVPDVAAAFLNVCDQPTERMPWMLFCPRPRVAVQPLADALSAAGYRMETLLPKIRYRKPFSAEELEEEIAAGIANGLSADACLVDGYFRVDLRLALPKEEDGAAAHQAVQGIDPNAI